MPAKAAPGHAERRGCCCVVFQAEHGERHARRHHCCPQHGTTPTLDAEKSA